MNREQFLRWWVGGIIVVAGILILGGVIAWRQNAPVSDEQFGHDLDPKKRTQLLQWISEYQALTEKEPNNPDHWLQLGLVRHQLGNIHGAIQSYEKAAQVNPRQYLQFEQVGVLYQRIGNYEKAERAYLAAIQNDPMKTHLYRHMLELYLNYIPEKKAKIPELLNAGLDIGENANSSELLSMLAIYYKNEGDTSNAIVAFERLLVAHPDNVTARRELEELKKKE